MGAIAICMALLGAARAAEVWLRIEASHSGETMRVEVPYTWMEEGIITPTMQAEIHRLADGLPELVAWSGDLPEGAVVPVATTPHDYDHVAMSLVGRSDAVSASEVVVESWDVDGRAAPETSLGLRTARMLLPLMHSMTVNGQALLAPAEEILSVDRALANMQRRPPTVLLEVTQASGRLRVSTR